MYDGVVQVLIDELGRLPGIGPKSAQRIAFYLMQADDDQVELLVSAVEGVKTRMEHCEKCWNISDGPLCRICQDPRRDDTALCVVEEAKDIVVIERSREFNGLYHVLGGSLSPIDGIGPEDIRIRELIARIEEEELAEVILATDPNLDGEATASYIARLIESNGRHPVVTRLASGLPVGGDLEFADEVTLGRAFQGRRLA